MTIRHYYSVMNIGEYQSKGIDKFMVIRRHEFEDNGEQQDEVSVAQGERLCATPEFLQRVLQVRERIMRESKGMLFEDSAELIRQQREERTQYLMELFTGDNTNVETNNQLQGSTIMALRKQEFDDNDEQSSKTTKRSRITIDVSPELRRRIKVAASQSDLSISEYLGRILEAAVPEETNAAQQTGQPVTRETIERLRRLREQIWEENNREFFEASAEGLRQQRDARTRYLMGEL